MRQLKTIIFGNAPLKIISLILGCMFWYMLSQGQTINVWLNVPVSFHNVPADLNIQSPETVAINIAGKRTDMYSLDKEQLAIHVDAHTLQQGDNLLTITPDALFLPDSITMVHYKPSNVVVELTTQPTTCM